MIPVNSVVISREVYDDFKKAEVDRDKMADLIRQEKPVIFTWSNGYSNCQTKFYILNSDEALKDIRVAIEELQSQREQERISANHWCRKYEDAQRELAKCKKSFFKRLFS
jgi:hypothetical protein